ncbi:MAG: nucleoside deaminase [Nitrosomonas sp.]|uniref:nucleoside deaminase n=1 Tax=Nitrosomonas sp. TaxID=42353 RepID=UPI001D4AC2C7|nr:nucleoside deaminase [Nitrosomonas sp.]MBX9895463.1 nucleoside deaminase [Nitrosomonas sp.]
MKKWTDILLPVPDWLSIWIASKPTHFPTTEQRMALVIDLARINVQQGGGPFAAAIFESDSGRLIAPGVNWVVPGKSSLLHAEIMALALAERSLGSYELAQSGSFELVTSVEPCCQCLGALIWAGVASVVCGACSDDAQAIGFDEGPRPANWIEELQKRGIAVTTGIMRPQSMEILQSYTGELYNRQRPGSNSKN